MRIKIVSEGTGATTKVMDADTGESINNCTGVTWEVDARGLAKVTLKLVNVPVVLVGSLVE